MSRTHNVLLFTLFFIVHCAFGSDCKDVYHYYCPFDGTNIANQAVKSNDPALYVYLPTPFVRKSDHAWSRMNLTLASNWTGRLLCTNPETQDAFSWIKNTNNTNFGLASLEINRTHKFCVDGLPIALTWGYKKDNYTNFYLNMNCELTTKESLEIENREDEKFKWEEYDVQVRMPDDAVKGGLDLPLNTRPFYIGLTRFQGVIYVAKIIQDTSWIEIIPNREVVDSVIYITAARDVKVLTSNQDRQSFYWVQINTLDGGSIKNISLNNLVNGESVFNVFRCLNGTQYLLTQNPDLCWDKTKIEMLVYKKFQLLNEPDDDKPSEVESRSEDDNDENVTENTADLNLSMTQENSDTKEAINVNISIFGNDKSEVFICQRKSAQVQEDDGDKIKEDNI